MFFSSNTLKASALAALASAALVSSAPAHQKHRQAKAVYFQTNSPQNNIMALPVQQDGTLAQGTMTPTGGQGLQEIDGMSGKPAAPDGLSSQDSVVVKGNNLFVVNSGSNTLSMFKIDQQDPTKLTMLGQPVDVNGEFPLSVAVSPKANMACVASSGAKAGVSCGKFSSAGMGQMDELRSLGLDLQQTTPPVGPTNTVADLLFSRDEQTLYAMVKGNKTQSQPGGIAAYPVTDGTPATTPVSNNGINGTAVLFGTTTIPGTTNLFATDASFGAAILTSKGGSTLSLQSTAKIADQKATCWIAISPFTKTAFVTDVGANHLVEMDTCTGQIIKEYQLTTPNQGMIDLQAAGQFIYALSPSANVSTAIQVFDVSGGKGMAKQIQNFLPTGANATVQGMAVKL